MSKTILPLAALTAVVVLAGCGPYTMESQYRPGIRTVYVPVWTRGRDVYRRDIEMRLTEAIQKRIEQDTPYKLTTRDRADTELRGQLKAISQQVLSKNPETGQPRDMEVTYAVSFTWEDLRTGEILVDESNFRVSDTYITAAPVAENFSDGSEAVINRLARRIVEKMEADWGEDD
jgi:outer membrane lipopolysaccharide assembly protein LptE/RlpB